jgi:succinate dehydrogenase/fumarate reductase flavoprotein subunit
MPEVENPELVDGAGKRRFLLKCCGRLAILYKNNRGWIGCRGLYAAGECAGGLFYNDYFGGGSIANCTVFGQIAGREAAGYARSRKQ